MAELKLLEQLTGWIEYRLKTDLLDPPVLRVRLRPLDAFDWRDAMPVNGEHRLGLATLEVAVEAVAEWDLSQNGQPIPIPADRKKKIATLRPLMAEEVAVREGTLLAHAIIADAQNRELFLKN